MFLVICHSWAGTWAWLIENVNEGLKNHRKESVVASEVKGIDGVNREA